MSTITRGKGRPAGYYVEGGKRVPGVTTIGGRFKDSGALIRAANRVGLEGKTLEEAWYGPSLSIGSQVHTMVEEYLNSEPVTKPTSLEAIGAFDAWKRWWEGARLTIEATEIPLVSEEHRFGGTIDAIERDSDGRLCIGDWKTSNGIYADYLVQVAAYGLLWNELNEEKITGGFHIVRFSKEHGDLEHRHYANLDDAAELFLLYRRAYDLDKDVARRAR